MLCLLALIAFAGLAVVSARYRPLTREALACVFRRVTLRRCTTGFDKRVKAAVVGRVMRTHPEAARLLHRHLEALAWTFVLVFAGSGTTSGMASTTSTTTAAATGQCAAASASSTRRTDGAATAAS
jgi:hypothetical protein